MTKRRRSAISGRHRWSVDGCAAALDVRSEQIWRRTDGDHLGLRLSSCEHDETLTRMAH